MILQDKLEEIASKSHSREVYNSFLEVLLLHIGIIHTVYMYNAKTRSLKLLAETYANASLITISDSKNQVMYDILREIAYQTAVSQTYVIYDKYKSEFIVYNAKAIISDTLGKSKITVDKKS